MSASSITIPRRLRAAAPGWTVTADVIVVGSGIAGLTTALRLRRRVARVLLVTKTVLDEGSTAWAQGGIAAVMSPDVALVSRFAASSRLASGTWPSADGYRSAGCSSEKW